MGLRKYQQEAEELIGAAFDQGHKSIALSMPTGSGKTVTFSSIALRAVTRGKRVMILVDRKELLEQAEKKLIKAGLRPYLIAAGKTVRAGQNCYVASVETLVRRQFPDIDLLIIDEAHKQSFDKVLKGTKYENIYRIGCSATFKRTGKMRQLSDYYTTLVEPTSISQLIAEGYLVPAITFGAKVDTSKIKTKGNDFDAHELSDFFNKQIRYDGLLEKYRKHASGTKAIVFHPSREVSIEAARQFNLAGIPSFHVDGDTPKKERENILEAFSKGMFPVIHNVEILTTGYDEWTIEAVIVNLGTKSLPKWLQMAGRGSRITPEEFVNVPGYLQKTHFNLIDMADNVFRLGFWEQDRTYSLEHKTKESIDAAPVKECPEDLIDRNYRFGCGSLLHLSASSCKFCGYVFPEKEKEELRQVEFTQLIATDFLPEGAAKLPEEMTMEELDDYREKRGYKLGWMVRQIRIRPDLDLEAYARYKDYKNPSALVEHWQRLYSMKFHYYYSSSRNTVWKQFAEYTGTDPVEKLTPEEFSRALSYYKMKDGDHLIKY